MTDKTNRLFLGAITCALAIAGTGLTLVNNIDPKNKQTWLIAGALACAFTVAEIAFLWAHVVFESLKKRGRKILLGLTMAGMIASMALAFGSELQYAFEKMRGGVQTSLANQILDNAMEKAQTSRERSTAIRTVIAENKISIQIPEVGYFKLCYGYAGLCSIIILAVREKTQKKTRGGNLIIEQPQLIEKVKSKFGFAPTAVYRDNKGNGYSAYNKAKYIGFITDKEIN